MSTASEDKPKKASKKASKKAPSAVAGSVKAVSRPQAAEVKKTTGRTNPSKPPRLCGACQGRVSASALYCRHCGLALSAEVPANPHLPPPPKPWRPSRIPKHRSAPALPPAIETAPSQAWATSTGEPAPAPEGPTPAPGAGSASVPSAVLSSPEPFVPQAAKPPAAPAQPRVWDPVPEVEAHIAQLKAQHERLRPQLARADLFKRRLRMP